MVIGAIEAGGTKMVCGIGNGHGDILERVSFPTTRPEETLQQIIHYFGDKEPAAIGIGSFGPIQADRSSPLYGHITTTPKLGWHNFDFLGSLKNKFTVPYGWDTDVNAAALGEMTWGAAQGLTSCAYYTIGTGIGVGVIAEGRTLHGLVHPEGGHILVRRHPEDSFEGCCPYHRDCLEGMASGPALEGRWGIKGSDLPESHPAWSMEAYYIGQAVAAAVLMLSPQKIIIGGGVMSQYHLYSMIREEVRRSLRGYISAPELDDQIDTYIVPPGLGSDSGLKGALALGINALNAGDCE